MKNKNFFKYHFPVIAFCLLIFILSSIPGDELPEIGFDFSFDKIIHFGIYFVLSLLFFYSLKNQTKSAILNKKAEEFAFFFTCLYGASDEFHQLFVVNRSAALDDLLADAIGAFAGYIICKVYLKKKLKNDESAYSGIA